MAKGGGGKGNRTSGQSRSSGSSSSFTTGQFYRMPGLRQALNAVNQLGQQMHGEATADYKVAKSASAAGQANLSRQTRALTRGLVMSQKQNAAAIGHLGQQARREQRNVNRQQASSVNRYGSALGASVAESFGQARAAASSGVKIEQGQAQASKATGAVAGTVAGIAAQGVAAQRAAANYSLNQALQQRNIVDNQTLANLTGQMYQQALAYNAQMQMYEKQRQDAAADAKKQELAQTRDTLGFLQNSTPEIGAWMQNELDLHRSDYINPDTGKIDVTKIRDAYAQYAGIDAATMAPGSQDATRLDVVTGIAREMQNGSDINTATTQALDTLYGSMPGWDRMAPRQLSSITAGIGAETESQATANLQSIGALSISTGGSFGIDSVSATDPRGVPGVNESENTATGFRDAGAKYIQDKYGDATARAWLRGNTSWSDSAIDSYLGMIRSADIAGDYAVTETGGSSGYAPAPATGYAPSTSANPRNPNP